MQHRRMGGRRARCRRTSCLMAVLVLFVALLGASPAAAWSIAGVKKAAAPNPAAAPPEPEKQQPETVGSKTYHPSFGLFSKGCKYRVVTSAADDSHSAHEFWDEDRNAWVAERTPGCFHTGHPAPGPPSFGFNGGSPRTAAASSDKHHTLIENLWYNNGRWYLLADGDTPVAPVRLSRNQETRVLHVANATRWLDAVSWRVVPGDTVFFDFVFFTHPTAIGHWWEMLGPLYSSLKRLSYRRPCDQFLLLHLKRRHLMEWVRAMIAVALGVPIKGHLPPIIMQEEQEGAFAQIASPLEGFGPHEWVVFPRVVLAKDLYTGGGRTFADFADAREFRSLVYQQYGLPPPRPRTPVPRLLVYQRKSANRRVLNEPAFLDLLASYGELRVVEFDASSSLHEQLLAVAAAGVFVSVHTSNLANAPLLQPGSAVVEIIQRLWSANGLDTSFRDQTWMMSDVHHFAWRASHLNETSYLDPDTYRKVGHWNESQCVTEECVEGHTQVDVTVDLAALKQLLDSRLPLVFSGASVSATRLAWPPAVDRYVETEFWPPKDPPAPAAAAAAAAAAADEGEAVHTSPPPVPPPPPRQNHHHHHHAEGPGPRSDGEL